MHVFAGRVCLQRQGSYPFSETNFQDFSRTQIDFSRALNFTKPLNSQDLNDNSPYCLTYISYFLVEFNKFPELSRTSGLFPGLSSPGKWHNKIPGLSKFSRTRTNPERKKIFAALFSRTNKEGTLH